MESINERIKRRRKQLGISVDKLAKSMGISRASYYRYESREIYNMPLDSIGILAKALYVEPEWIMGWTDDARLLSEEENELLTIFRTLTLTQKAALLGVARSFVETRKESVKNEES